MEFDVTTAVTAFGGTVAGLGLLGAAKLLPNVAIKAWSWFTAAIRGG